MRVSSLAKEGRMSKNQQVHRPSAMTGDRLSSDVMRETLSALIKEAHVQRNIVNTPTQTNLFERPRQSFGAKTAKFMGSAWSSPMLPEKLQPLLRESAPRRRLAELILEKATRDEIREFIHEVSQTAVLRAHSLEPRHTVLLVGPPGTGKTSLAGVLATELALPFLTVRYDGLVGSYLGETASRLQDIVDYVSHTPCVLFFDEFDSVGKERSDAHETGEIKRVVSSLLLHMDALPTTCIVVCATNHPELLDRAVWRRFELRLELPRPGATELKDWFSRSEKALGPLGMTSTEFVAKFKGETFSEIEAITLDARRQVVLSQRSLASADAFKNAVARWERRRKVGGVLADGARSNSEDKPRARTARKASGSKAAPA